MVGLAKDRAAVRHLPHKPLVDGNALAQVGGIQPTEFFTQVGQDRTGLEDRDRLATGPLGIDDRWDAVVGRNRQELRLELVTPADVYEMRRVRDAQLLQRDGNLEAVRGVPVVELDRHSLDAGHERKTLGGASGGRANNRLALAPRFDKQGVFARPGRGATNAH